VSEPAERGGERGLDAAPDPIQKLADGAGVNYETLKAWLIEKVERRRSGVDRP
jgi:hypothetical protein